MTNPLTDSTLDTTKDTQTLESSLRTLWDKIKAASELLQKLKQEKQGLQLQMENLISENQTLQNELGSKEQEIKRLKAECAHLEQVSSGNGFSDEEKEILKGKIRDLIAKINSHL